MTRTVGAAVGAILIIAFMAVVASRLSAPPSDPPVASLASSPRR